MIKRSHSNAIKTATLACFASVMGLFGFSLANENASVVVSEDSQATHTDPVCDCLKESRDLWLCGLAEEPLPPYDTEHREQINNILVESALHTNNCPKPEDDKNRDEKP